MELIRQVPIGCFSTRGTYLLHRLEPREVSGDAKPMEQLKQAFRVVG